MDTIINQSLQIFNSSVLRYFLLAGIPFIIFYKFLPAKMVSRKIQQRSASKKDFLREIWHSMQSTLVFTIITCIIMFTPVRNYTQLYTNINDFPIWYLILSVALSLVIHDTYFYWMHRIMHHKTLFNLTHLVHHRSTNPSPWTSYSFHLLEAVVEGGVLLVITVVMPMHPLSVLLFTVVAFMINVYGHLGYELMPKGFRKSPLFEVLNSSVHHNLHHSKFKGNYGLYFRVWDRLMGTEHPDYVKEYDKVQARRFPETAQQLKQAA
ncbi:sterol desaturase family protein [Chitinophaga silvatica]|uniref:Sterol desaturase family protein n=1 Tax=Chitinophaga silvatica TaxID=2282649 RepID=A0A3E1YA00_9BACT|nr:sterol desaturase family protein [Chitinophaga silvatica]RFS22574.1 sterol desaturase family protein [Chitinophaga silvatica]